jgi:cyclopropane fatty-acyl-phospholipid synthase-like methyltransferase
MSFARSFFYSLPPSLRFAARRLYYLPTDVYEGWTGQRDALTPPKGLIYTGSGDFRAQGQQLLQLMRELGQLQPEHHLLDIGSGIGRLAVALTDFLHESARYEGFDVVKLGVNWCQQHISATHPNFHFQYIPLENDLYRSDGEQAQSFRFPYADTQFDRVAVFSVFTHMLPDQVANYMQEIQRVLRPGGRCVATFFIINDTSERLMADNPAFQFPYNYGHYRLMDKQVQSANVAFAEKHLLEKFVDKSGLALRSLHYGHWSGRLKADCPNFQDVVVLEKQ